MSGNARGGEKESFTDEGGGSAGSEELGDLSLCKRFQHLLARRNLYWMRQTCHAIVPVRARKMRDRTMERQTCEARNPYPDCDDHNHDCYC